MTSAARKDFDLWFAGEYDLLVEAAQGMHREARDLVHHTYIACINAAAPHIMNNPAGYFHTAMWTQATRGAFKAIYATNDIQAKDLPGHYDLSASIAREEAMILTRHLAWFDREVLRLYLEGYNLRQVSRESGIAHTTLYQSLWRTRKKLKHAIGKPRHTKVKA